MAQDIYAIWWLLAWIYVCFVVAHVAGAKGLPATGWVIGAILFGPFALFGLLAMPVDQIELTRRRIAAGLAKICPDCAEPMRKQASICPSCRSHQPFDGSVSTAIVDRLPANVPAAEARDA